MVPSSLPHEEVRPPGDVLDTPAAGGLVVRGGVLRVLGLVAGTLLSLVGVVLLSRHLGVAGYGRYQTAVSVIAIVQVVVDAGMGTAGAREYAQRTGPDRDRFVRVLLGLRLALTTLGVGLAAAVVAGAGDGALAAGTALLGAGLLVALVQATLALPLAVELRLGTLAAMDLVRQALATAAIVALVLAGAGLVPVLAATIPAQLAVLVWTWRVVRGRVPVRPIVRLAEMAAIVRPVAAVALATTVGVAYLYAAQVLTAIAAGPRETGIYALAFRVFVVAASIPATLASAAFPLLARAARDDRERLRGAVAQLTAGLALLGCAMSLGFAFAAGPVIDVVGGSASADSEDVLRILAVVLPVTCVLPALGFAQLAIERHRPLTLANLSGLVALLIGIPIGVAVDGATGAAIASVCGEVVVLAGYALALRGGGLPVDVAAPARALAALALGWIAGALAVAADLPDLAAAAVALAVFAPAALSLGAVPHGLRQLLPRAPEV